MTYKAVPGPKIVAVDKNQNSKAATDEFAKIINQEAQGGWVYHSMETITVEQKVGCSLKPEFIKYNIYMLIFYQN